MTAYSDLHDAALGRLEQRVSGKIRVLVQMGNCGRSVGADVVADALGIALAGRSDAYLTVGGCDGACFATPQVIVTIPSGQTRRYQRISPADVPALVDTLDAWPVGPDVLPDGDGFGLRGGSDLAEFFGPQTRLLLARCGYVEPGSMDEYLADGGYSGLSEALSRSPEEVIQTVREAGLLGRGGAYFPAAIKWQAARAAVGIPYVVVNAEEGEPGIFKDRHILEGDPHLLLEGMLIAAYATGAVSGYIYVNAEAELPAERLEAAIEKAWEVGIIGENILGSGFSFQVTVRRGAGGYVCGEETTMLDTIEGNRREPRLRPPFPTESGLFRQPTVINNVETLANVPLIMRGSAYTETPQPTSASFASLGLENARGTKLVCLSGAVRRPGMAEVPMGTTLRQVVYDIGGGPQPGRRIGIIAVGGPSSGILPAQELDLPLRPGMLHPSGVVMGAGGVMVVDETVSAIEIVRRLAAYNADESCGKCTPCREGTPRIVEALDRLASNRTQMGDLDDLLDLAEIVGSASLCGLGQMAGNPITSALHFFPDELGAG